MKTRPLAKLAALWMIPLCALYARAEEPRPPLEAAIRWTAAADWEYYQSKGELQGVNSDLTSLRQKYALGAGGFVWHPRFNRYSVGLDLFRTDGDSDGKKIDSRSLGYRVVTTFFPSRPFPLTLYGRRAMTDTSGAALANSDRETAAWGVEWNLAMPAVKKLRLLFDRTRYDLISSIEQKDRRQNGLLDFDTKAGSSDVSFHYGFHTQEERVSRSEFQRQDLAVTDRTRFANGAVLTVNGRHTFSEANYAGGQQDALTSSRFFTRFDLPQRQRWRVGWSYDYTDNDGRFLDSSSHTFKTQARRQMGRGWDSTGGIKLGRIHTDSTSGAVDEDVRGVHAGVGYTKEWSRFRVGTGYALAYDRAVFRRAADRRTLSQRGELSGYYDLNHDDQVFAVLSLTRDDNDTTGVGYTLDRNRLAVGWEGRSEAGWKMRSAAVYSQSIRDTFQFGVTTSEEISIDGSLVHWRGGFSVSLATHEGISEFLPDPTDSSPFIEETDLVNQANIGSLEAHWRFWRNLRARLHARLEDRHFTSTGDERIISYRPQIDYTWTEWTFSAALSHYERSNHPDFRDDTLLMKVTRRFV